MKIRNYLILGFLSLLSCDKKDIVIMEDPPVIEDTSGIQVFWHTKLDTIEPYGDYNIAGGSPIFFENEILFVKRNCLGNACDYQGEIKSFDKRSGETLWSYDIDDLFKGVVSVEKFHDDKLILLMHHGIVGFDVQSRKVLWKTLYRDVVSEGKRGGFSIALFNEVGVISIEQGSSPYYDATYLYKFNLASGMGEIIYEVPTHEVEGNGILTFYLGASTVHKYNQTGDEKLIFRVDTDGPSSSINRPRKLYCFNMTADSLEWESPSYTTLPSMPPLEPIIYKDWVFMTGSYNSNFETWLYKFDLSNGEIVDSLRTPTNSGYGTSQFLLHEGDLLLNPVGNELFSVDPVKMEINWECDEDIANACLNSCIYDDVWFINSWGEGSIFAVDVHSGEVLDEFKSPFQDGFTGEDITVDPETGILYTQNFKNAIALKFNRE
jgi:hypothetical protein